MLNRNFTKRLLVRIPEAGLMLFVLATFVYSAYNVLTFFLPLVEQKFK